MKGGINRWARSWLPPALLTRLRGRLGIRYEGSYSRWEESAAVSAGYNAPFILDRVAVAARRAKEGTVAADRDGATLDSVEPSWPVLAALLGTAAGCGGRLVIMDFGGGLGSTYRHCAKFLAGVSYLRWTVVEQASFVALGRREFEDGVLSFHGDWCKCREEFRPDVLLLSGVLQYLPDPRVKLEEFARSGFTSIVVDRTPVTGAGRDRLAVQRLPRRLGGESYPCWLFSEDSLWAQIEKTHGRVSLFDSLDPARGGIRFRGGWFAAARGHGAAPAGGMLEDHEGSGGS
jgi:putative methyltransferase (TIGR04325 family)